MYFWGLKSPVEEGSSKTRIKTKGLSTVSLCVHNSYIVRSDGTVSFRGVETFRSHRGSSRRSTGSDTGGTTWFSYFRSRVLSVTRICSLSSMGTLRPPEESKGRRPRGPRRTPVNPTPSSKYLVPSLDTTEGSPTVVEGETRKPTHCISLLLRKKEPLDERADREYLRVRRPYPPQILCSRGRKVQSLLFRLGVSSFP